MASLGLNPGDRVAVQVEKSPECLMLYLATLRAGMVYVPLNTAYQRAELEHFLRDAETCGFRLHARPSRGNRTDCARRWMSSRDDAG